MKITLLEDDKVIFSKDYGTTPQPPVSCPAGFHLDPKLGVCVIDDVPVPPQPTGEWSEAVKGATKITEMGPNGYEVKEIPVSEGKTTCALFVPKDAGMAFVPIFKVVVFDPAHKATSKVYVDVMELNMSNDPVKAWLANQGGTDDWVFGIKMWTLAKQNAGGKFLIRMACSQGSAKLRVVI